MIIDSDKGSSIRFGNRFLYGGGVNPNHGSMCRRSDIKKWRARMLLHRKIRKTIEKKRWQLTVQSNVGHSVVVSSSPMMKRRKSFRTEENGSVDKNINLDCINGLNCFQARMFLLQKVRCFQKCDFPEELVGQCILNEPRKRALFQESVRMCAASAVLRNKCFGNDSHTRKRALC